MNYVRVFHRTPQGGCPRIEDTVFSGNPLLASAIRENVRIVGRRALIPLLPRWPVLFRGLRTFGRVTSFCRNSFAMLGSVGVYPEVWSTPCGRSARGGDLTFSFPCWSRALATIQERSGDWLYAAEFLDAFGNMIHKVCLTPESDSEAFRWWVELNHATSPTAELSPYARFAPAVDDSDAHCEDDASVLSEDDFRALLRRSIEEETSVQILVANEGLAQGARMVPNCLRDDGDWIYLGDSGCGLQLRTGRPSQLSFRWSSSSREWVLKAYESEGRLVCTLFGRDDEE